MNRATNRARLARQAGGQRLQADAMATFLAGKSLSANQIEFVNLIVDHLTEHGLMEPAMLYESPFTDLTPRGPDELFSSPHLDELVAVIERVRHTAIAA